MSLLSVWQIVGIGAIAALVFALFSYVVLRVLNIVFQANGSDLFSGPYSESVIVIATFGTVTSTLLCLLYNNSVQYAQETGASVVASSSSSGGNVLITLSLIIFAVTTVAFMFGMSKDSQTREVENTIPSYDTKKSSSVTSTKRRNSNLVFLVISAILAVFLWKPHNKETNK